MRTTFQGTAGIIDARIHGEGRPVLVCHPHPHYGGTKSTRLVYLICKALADAGFQAVRFDFRGAGQSEGTYDGGPGETEDALVVWDAISKDQPAAVIGFSFGGGVAVRLATKRDVPALITVAAPAKVRDCDLRPGEEGKQVTAAAAVIMGTKDELVPIEDGEQVAAALGTQVQWIDGADHFLTPTHQAECVARVVASLQALL